MPVTMEQVRAKLEPIEPDFVEAATLGPDAIPFLEELAISSDLQFAPRAVYLASLIGGDRAVQLLLSAVRSPITIVRVQAAAAARNLPAESAESILLRALDDVDSGARNVALKSVRALFPNRAMSELVQTRISVLSRTDPERFIRKHSEDVLAAMGR